jgi:hypothetical protein
LIATTGKNAKTMLLPANHQSPNKSRKILNAVLLVHIIEFMELWSNGMMEL